MKIIKENNNQFNEEDIYNYFSYINEDIESKLFNNNIHELTKSEEVEKLFYIDKNNDKLENSNEQFLGDISESSSHNDSLNENYDEIKNYNINSAYTKLVDNISKFEI